MKLPVYLINLDGSDERLREASAQLEAAGLAFQRVPAFDGRKLRIEEFPDYDAKAAISYMGRPLRGGEIGCYLSHLEAARQFLASDAPYGLVLEDDIEFRAGFVEGLEQVMGWLDRNPVEWDVINIGANRHRIYTPLFRFEADGQEYDLTRGHYFPMMACSLIWSRRGAEAFVSQHRRITMPVDNYFRHWQTRVDRGLAVWPPLVATNGADSDIDAGSGKKRSAEGRHPLYGFIKQRRLMVDKWLAWRHKKKWARKKPS